MNTQLPILNSVSSANTAPRPAPVESARAETPFNQILNKEVDNRKSNSNANTSANETNSTKASSASDSNSTKTSSASDNTSSAASSAAPAQTNTQNQSKPADSAQDSAQDSSQDSDQDTATASAAAAATAAGASKAGKTVATDHKHDHAKQDDEHETSNAASAQMLALVSSVGLMNNQPVAKKATDGHTEGAAERKNDKNLIGAVGVGAAIDAKEKFSHLKSEDAGKDNIKQFSLDDSQEKPASNGKDILDGKSTSPLQAVSTKGLPEASLTTGGALTNAQEKNLAASAHDPKLPVAANAKPVDGAQPPNPLILAPALQQAMNLNQQVAMTGQPTERLTPTVGSPGWDEAVGQKVTWMASGGLQSASLTLNPPDLGPLQVVLHVNNDHAEATFITAQPEVKQALEAAMPKLREMMDQAGIQLGQATVSTGMPNQQQGQQQTASGRDGRASFGKDGSDEAELNVTTIGVRPAASGGLGLVDTFA